MPDESLHIRLFGDFSLRRGDAPVAALSPREQSLLAYLLLHRDVPSSRQHLAYLFWPDSTDTQARSQLRKLFYRLRQDLPDADAYLHVDTQTAGWRSEVPFTLDVAEFERALALAAEKDQLGQHAEACAALERAAALYSGDLLPGCYDDWIVPDRARLSLSYLHALERLVELCEQGREYQRAIEHAQRLLHHDPLYEPTYRALMRLHALTGNRAAALRAYHTCATTLQRELDVDPSPDTQQAYERLLQVALPSVPATTVPAVEISIGDEIAADKAVDASPMVASMVGRRDEWDQLMAAWHDMFAGRDVRASRPQLVVIEGEAGIGKTRLAEELARWARWQGAATAAARCYAAEGALAYAPVVQWLRARPLPVLEVVWRRELARLLPELLAGEPDLLLPAPMTEAWQRQRLFQALARAVLGDPPHIAGTGHIPAGPQPLLLFIDDLQWCDRQTLEWLHYLLREHSSARLLVLSTVRMEEVDEDHMLPAWLRAVRRVVDTREMALGPLDEAETQALAAGVAGVALDPGLAACIYGETEGNPLFVIEIVRATRLSDEAEPACPPQGLPPRVQATIEERLARLSLAARELAGLAAAVGREFTYAVLEGACDLDADALLRALDELWQRRVVREMPGIGPGAGYDFTHDKLREVAYAGLSGARRQVLHRRVAGALEALHTGDLDAVAGQIAAHYDRGGQAARAISYHLRAAEHARRVYANEEAAGHYDRVLALAAASAEQRVQARSGLGQVYMRLGRLHEAEVQFRAAIALGRETVSPPRQIARLYYWLGQALHQQLRYDQVSGVGEEGLALLGEDTASIEAVLLLDTIATGYDYTGSRVRAREFWRRAAALAENLPYADELGTIYSFVFSLYLRDKQVDQATRWLRTLEAKIASDPNERAQGIVHQRMEELLARQGDLRGAIAHLQQALAHVTHTGDVSERDFYLWRLGFRSLSTGDVLKAEEYARASFELKLIIGSMYHYFPWGSWLLGLIGLCRGNQREAVERLEQAVQEGRQSGYPEIEMWSNQMLGRMYLDRGERGAALERYRRAAAACTPEMFLNWRARELRPYSLVFAGVLGGLEEACAGAEDFRAICRQHPGWEAFVVGVQRSPDLAQFALGQWFLEPTTLAESARPALDEAFRSLLPIGLQASAWTWYDPYGDCCYTLQDGLRIEAANGRDLWHVNWSAPRFLYPLSSVLADTPGAGVPGVAVETICASVSDDRLAMGGLLLWIDPANYIRLDWGMGGLREVTLLGCVGNQDMVFGRGLLPPDPVVLSAGSAGRVWLRLEWVGGRVHALCSVDGQAWYTAGQAVLPYNVHAQVGMYACGSIDRTIYHGAYPEGTAIRFESFRCWTLSINSL
jgi:DNA-binding SARP family transcriptional activator